MTNNTAAARSSKRKSAPGAMTDTASEEGIHPASSKGTRKYIVDDVISGLYDGRYEPGQRLQEAQLTASYGVSRGPVREALNTLATLGLVDLTLQRGAQVRILRIKDAIDTIILAQTLIGLAARLAALNNDHPAARARLEAALEHLLSFPTESSDAKFAIAKESFYAAITAMANNSELTRLMPSVHVHLIRVQFKSILRTHNSTRHQDYKKIGEAILSGNPRNAENAVRDHLNKPLKSLMKFQEEQQEDR